MKFENTVDCQHTSKYDNRYITTRWCTWRAKPKDGKFSRIYSIEWGSVNDVGNPFIVGFYYSNLNKIENVGWYDTLKEAQDAAEAHWQKVLHIRRLIEQDKRK